MRDGELIFARSYGRATLDHDVPLGPRSTFNLGSTSKQFLALAALMLARDGRLDLDADVRGLVPELAPSEPPIRARDLLLQTSGIRDLGTLDRMAGRRTKTMSDALATLGRQRGLNFRPGTRHWYSHSEYLVLGVVVERAAGVPLARHLEQTIFGPLGMTSTRVHDVSQPPIPGRVIAYEEIAGAFRSRFPDDELIGGANVFSSIEDLAKWERNFLTASVGGRDLIDTMVASPRDPAGKPIAYAYGLRHGKWRGLRTITRSSMGGGTPTEQMRFPDEKLAVYTLCSVDPSHPRLLSRAVAELFLGDRLGPTEVPAEPAPAPADEVERYSGWYESELGRWLPVRFLAKDGVLGEETTEGWYPMRRLGTGRYAGGDWLTYEFEESTVGPMRLTMRTEDGTEKLVRATWTELWKPSTADLASYAGLYYSDEIAALWRISVEDGGLVLRRDACPGAPRLEALERDVFRGDIGGGGSHCSCGLEFERDAEGRVVAFAASAVPNPYEPALGVRFVRHIR